MAEAQPKTEVRSEEDSAAADGPSSVTSCEETSEAETKTKKDEEVAAAEEDGTEGEADSSKGESPGEKAAPAATASASSAASTEEAPAKGEEAPSGETLETEAKSAEGKRPVTEEEKDEEMPAEKRPRTE